MNLTNQIHEVLPVTDQRSDFCGNVAMIMSETRCFPKNTSGGLLLYMDDIIKPITPSPKLVTNLSNDNVSL